MVVLLQGALERGETIMAKRSGIMLAHKLTPARLAKLPAEVIFQPKINGMRCRAEHSDGITELFSSQGTLIVSVPHINAAITAACAARDIKWCTLDGELCRPATKFQDVCSLVKRNTPHPESATIVYNVFDLISDNTQNVRLYDLHWLLEPDRFSPVPSAALSLVPFYYAPKHEWEHYFELFVAQGYEGVIIRDPIALYEPCGASGSHRCSGLLKHKARHTATFPVWTFYEELSLEGHPNDTLGGLVLGHDPAVFRCGCGQLNRSERLRWWHHYRDGLINPTDFVAVVRYPELTNRGVPHMAVLVEIKRKGEER